VSWEGQSVVKHAWNSAIRETERLAGVFANQEQTTYNLVNSSSVRDDLGFYFVSGFREWHSVNGKVVRFNIQMEPQPA